MGGGQSRFWPRRGGACVLDQSWFSAIPRTSVLRSAGSSLDSGHPTAAKPNDLGSKFPHLPWLRRIAFCVCAVLVAHVAQLLILRGAEQTALQDGQRRAELAVAGTEAWFRRTFEEVDFGLELLEHRQALVDVGDPRSGEIEDILEDITTHRHFDIWVALSIDPNGIARWASTKNARMTDKSMRPHVRSLGPDPTRIYVTDPYTGIYSGRTMVAFSRRLNHVDGSPAGISSIAVDPIALSRHLVDMMPQQHESVGVWRDGGEAILLTSWGRGTGLPPTLPAPEMTAALAGHDSGTFEMVSPIRHCAVLAAFKRLPDIGLVVTSSIDMSDVMGGVNAARGMIWVADTTVGLLAFAAMMWQRQIAARRRVMGKLTAITDRANRASAVQAEIDRAMDILPGAIYRVRLYPGGRCEFLFVSRSVERVTGWPSSMLLHMPGGISDIFEVPFSQDERIEAYARQSLDELVHFERRVRRRDGSLCWMRFSQQTVSTTGACLDLVGLVTDIEVERASAATAISTARLVTLGEMATGLAHEISQPLAMMSLAAENAINAINTKSRAAAIERMQRIPDLAQRVRTIIDHLRLFARQQPNGQEAVYIDDVMSGALLLVDGALKDACINLTITLDSELPAVLAEQVMLEQVLVNLLLNARDAMAMMPTASRHLEIMAQRVGDVVELMVDDTGSGIAEGVLPHLFEPFFTTKPPGFGTGLGLSICHGIVRSFGGAIYASNHGLGARFTVILRLAPPPSSLRLTAG